MSKSFNEATLKQTAKLARLKLTPAGEAKLAKELPVIIDFVEGLNKAVSQVHQRPKDAPQALQGRKDASTPPRWPLKEGAQLIAMAPAKRDGFVEVKHVFN